MIGLVSWSVCSKRSTLIRTFCIAFQNLLIVPVRIAKTCCLILKKHEPLSREDRVVELKGNWPKYSTCQSGTQLSVLSIWGLISGLVSQVPSLGNTIVVVGDKKLSRSAFFNFVKNAYLHEPHHTPPHNTTSHTQHNT